MRQAQLRLEELKQIANYFLELMKGLQLDPSPSTSPRDAEFKFDRSLIHGVHAELQSGLNRETIHALRSSATEKKSIFVFRIPKPHERAESQMAALDLGIKLGEYEELLNEKRQAAYEALLTEDPSIAHAPPRVIQLRVNAILSTDEKLLEAKQTLEQASKAEQKRLKRMHVKDKSKASGIFISRQEIERRGIRLLEDGKLTGELNEKYWPTVSEDGHKIEFIAQAATFTEHDIRMMLKAGLISPPKKDADGNMKIQALNGSFSYILKPQEDGAYNAITEDGTALCRLYEFDPTDQNLIEPSSNHKELTQVITHCLPVPQIS